MPYLVSVMGAMHGGWACLRHWVCLKIRACAVLALLTPVCGWHGFSAALQLWGRTACCIVGLLHGTGDGEDKVEILFAELEKGN
eukprot:356851-Chlamydomonas_euryale.AAC.2